MNEDDLKQMLESNVGVLAYWNGETWSVLLVNMERADAAKLLYASADAVVETMPVENHYRH